MDHLNQLIAQATEHCQQFADLLDQEQQALLQQDMHALQPLVEATHDSFWQVREKAVDALGKLGAVGAIPALGVCARDPMSNLRKAAIGALGAIAHNDGRPFVELAMDDPDPDVRKLARWAMSKLDAAA